MQHCSDVAVSTLQCPLLSCQWRSPATVDLLLKIVVPLSTTSRCQFWFATGGFARESCTACNFWWDPNIWCTIPFLFLLLTTPNQKLTEAYFSKVQSSILDWIWSHSLNVSETIIWTSWILSHSEEIQNCPFLSPQRIFLTSQRLDQSHTENSLFYCKSICISSHTTEWIG